MADTRRTSTLVQKAESLVGRLVGLNDPTAAAEICEALASCLEGAQAGTVDDTLALEAGRLATVRHPNKPAVLLSVGRLYLASGLLERAYRALADGLQGGAKGYRPYRLLGEALLRLGDAQLAMPMFKRAMLEGDDDPDTGAWYACAKAYVGMQESQGSDAVARDVERRRRPEKPQEREKSLPRFPSLLDCSEISNMVTNRVAAAKLPRAQPPPLPQERTRTDAPCTVSLDEPREERRDLPPIDLVDEESSGERAETVKLDAKQVLESIAKAVKPPPLPPDSRAKPSARPPPLPVTPPSRPVSAAPPPAKSAPPAASKSETKPASAAPESQTKSASAASSAPPPAGPTPAAPSIVPPPLPSVAPTAKAASVSPSGVNQALWEAEVTPRHLSTPAPAKGARRPFRHWKWVQAAALIVAGAAFGFFGGKFHGKSSAESEAGRPSQAAPAEAATSAAIASAAQPAQPVPASKEPAAAGTAGASASAAAAAANARKAPPFDPFSPVGRLYSTSDAAVIVAGVPLAAVVSPAIAAGKQALATRPSLARPGGRVWP